MPLKPDIVGIRMFTFAIVYGLLQAFYLLFTGVLHILPGPHDVAIAPLLVGAFLLTKPISRVFLFLLKKRMKSYLRSRLG